MKNLLLGLKGEWSQQISSGSWVCEMNQQDGTAATQGTAGSPCAPGAASEYRAPGNCSVCQRETVTADGFSSIWEMKLHAVTLLNTEICQL